jgi:hypothetical protein
MALMEYCLVNIVLGDSDLPKPPEPAKQDKIFELAAKVKVTPNLFFLPAFLKRFDKGNCNC